MREPVRSNIARTIIWTLFGCCSFVYSSVEDWHDSLEHEAARRRKATVKPLPRTRPRTLTNPPPPKKSILRPKQKAHYQVASPFFQLPAELRLMIYRKILDCHDIHIQSMHRALGAFRGSTVGRYEDLDLHPAHPDVCSHFFPTKRQKKCKDGIPGLVTYAGSGIGALPILRVCRKM